MLNRPGPAAAVVGVDACYHIAHVACAEAQELA